MDRYYHWLHLCMRIYGFTHLKWTADPRHPLKKQLKYRLQIQPLTTTSCKSDFSLRLFQSKDHWMLTECFWLKHSYLPAYNQFQGWISRQKKKPKKVSKLNIMSGTEKLTIFVCIVQIWDTVRALDEQKILTLNQDFEFKCNLLCDLSRQQKRVIFTRDSIK